jgi:hypothetical protein
MKANRRAQRSPRWSRVPIAIALFGALALAGCTNATLVNVWRDPSFQGAKLHRVLIASRHPDAAARRIWEDTVRNELAKNGVEAVASYQVFPDGVPSKSALASALEEKGFDAAMVLKPLPPTSERRWVPGYSTTEPRVFYDPWSDRQVFRYRERYHRGYPVVEHYSREQVTLWSPGHGGQMVWAGTVLIPYSSEDRDLALR